MEDFIEQFVAYQCYTVFNLYLGYDAHLPPRSHDLRAFYTPLGLLRNTTMPQGFTNSPAKFQNSVAFLLQDEIPRMANGFIDNLSIKGRNYSEIARPLTELVRKDVELFWDDQRDEAFVKLKKLIMTVVALIAIDYLADRPVYISVDSSQIAVRFILSQDDEQG